MYQDLDNGAKKLILKDACMKFYNAFGPLYLETEGSGVSIGVRIFQVRDDMNCGCDKVPDNATLCPITFASKSPV